MGGNDEDLEILKNTWSKLAEEDPLWAIVTNPNKKGGRWDIETFLYTGVAGIDQVLEEIVFLDFPLVKGTALDFGCGVGRLTQPLGKHFEEVHGVDIAPAMIELAKQLASDGSNCHYHLNQKKDLAFFADDFFDFIYSRLVLQHIRPKLSKNYISEFVRIVKPGGLIAFQLPVLIGVSDPDLADIEKYLKPSARFVAQIEPFDQSIRLTVNELRDLKVRLKNISRVSWLSKEDSDGKIQIDLGYRWIRNDNSILQAGKERSPIPRTLHPGEEIELSILIRSVEFDGNYKLELDMVQEGVCWFKQKGNESTPIAVEVTGASKSISYRKKVRDLMSRYRKKQPSDSGPKFEMHGIPSTAVIEVIEESGGQVVAMQYANEVGPYRKGYVYFVTK